MKRAVAVVMALSCTSAAADDRRVVAVRVVVEAPKFRREFTEPGGAVRPGLADGEREAGERIAKALDDRAGFLRFGTAPAAATLTIRVISKAPDDARTALQEFGLLADVAGTGVARGEAAYWVLRRQGDLRAFPSTGQELAAEIADRVVVERDALIRDVLSRVPIAVTSAMLKDPWGWIIPFKPEEICADLRSRFAVSNEIQQAIGRREVVLPAEFTVVFDPPGATTLEDQRHRIFTDALDHPELALLKTAPAATVKAVRVIQYLRQDGCGRQAPPAEAFR